MIGPVNDITFLQLTKPVPASLCGPFATERAFLAALDTGTRAGGPRLATGCIYGRSNIYDDLRPLYTPRVDAAAPFHFAHADLSRANLMVDPESGEITGLIDWEMAGFRPAWLCATSGTWFDDDSCRFVVGDHQDGPDGYGEDTEMDTVLRQTFLPSRKRVTRHCWTTTAREWNCRRCFTICAMSTRRIRCYGLRNIRSTIGM